jgi:hypothetical protein
MADSGAQFRYKLERPRVDAIPRDVVLEELRAAARNFGGRRFSRHEFDAAAMRCKGSTVLKHFGTWSAALEAIGLPLKPHRPDRTQISEDDLLEELGRIWGALGHRPSKLEWHASEPRYSYTTYKQRFGGWGQACAAFVES